MIELDLIDSKVGNSHGEVIKNVKFASIVALEIRVSN